MDHVLEVALRYVERTYENWEVVSDLEFMFFGSVASINTDLLTRASFNEQLARFVINVVPINIALPEHDGLQSLVAEVGKHSNPAHNGFFHPIFLRETHKCVTLGYEASMVWSPLTKPRTVEAFIADAVKRGGIAAVALDIATGSEFKKHYPPALGLRTALAEVPPGYRLH